MLSLPGWSDPLALILTGAGAVLALGLLRLALGARGQALARRVEALAQGQERLIGALTQVTEAQAMAQSRLVETVETRLDRVQARMGDALGSSATRTADSLGALGARIGAIDAAQARIERLSGEMLSLRDILADKQARGLYGEMQMADILAGALAPDGYTLQATLSNGRRADALIHLPGPPGPIAMDAKFPLEGYSALREAGSEAERKRAETALRSALTSHVRAIATRYILPGETADQALMFLPSEAVFAELHARFADVVRGAMEARVWIVSPTTLMAVLTTMRGAARDARLVSEAGRVRRELALLEGDLARIAERVTGFERHFAQADADLSALRTAADRAGRRAGRLGSLDFGAPAGEGAAPPASQPATVSAPATGANPSNSGGPR